MFQPFLSQVTPRRILRGTYLPSFAEPPFPRYIDDRPPGVRGRSPNCGKESLYAARNAMAAPGIAPISVAIEGVHESGKVPTPALLAAMLRASEKVSDLI